MSKIRRWIYMIAYLVLDIVLAAGIVYGYYWGTFCRAQKPNADDSGIVITNPNQETAKNPGESQTEGEGTVSDDTKEENSSEENDNSSGDSANNLDGSKEESGEASSDISQEETTIEKPGIERLMWTEKFLEHFTEEPVLTDNSYSDSHVSVTVTRYEQGSGADKITYYVADIYVAAIEYFGSGIYMDDGTFQYTTTPEQFAKENPMDILITNGDYCSYNRQGVIIRNGRVYRNEASDVELCVLRYDGQMEIYQPNTYTLDMAMEDGVWQTWCFGPSLLDEEGHAKEDFLINSYLRKAHPRTAMGYYEPGHYCLVVIDGREDGYSRGMTMTEMSMLFQDLGCQAAYNLDGGGSSCMVFGGEAVNHTTQRYISDFILLSTEPIRAAEW